MKLKDLPGACKGQTDQKIEDLIRSTDEYQAVVTSAGGTPRLTRDMFNAGMLLVRGDHDTDRAAMWQAAEQGMVADAAGKLATSKKELTWVPSGPFKEVLEGKNDSFVQFLMGDRELALDKTSTTFNCWEAIIVAAMLAEVIKNGTSLVTLYQQGSQAFANALTRALVTRSGRDFKAGSLMQMPVCGDIVLFDKLSHVAIATGENGDFGSRVLSFWPAPVKSAKEFGKHGTKTPMLLTTIEQLDAWMRTNLGTVPKITFGSPSWQDLNQK